MGLGDRIKHWFSPNVRPLSRDMRYMERYYSLGDVVKKDERVDRRLSVNGTGECSSVGYSTNTNNHYQERAVDCDGINNNGGSRRLNRQQHFDPLSIDELSSNGWDMRFLRRKTKPKNSIRPASACDVSLFDVNFNHQNHNYLSSNQQQHMIKSKSIYALDKIGMDTIRSEIYDTKMKFRETFARNLWSSSIVDNSINRDNKDDIIIPQTTSSVVTNRRKSMIDDRDLHIFNKYFNSTDNDTSPPTVYQRRSSSSNQRLPKISTEYSCVIDDISKTNDIDNTKDHSISSPIVSPTTTTVSFDDQLLLTDIPTTSNNRKVRRNLPFIAEVIIDFSSVDIEIEYSINANTNSSRNCSGIQPSATLNESILPCILLYADGRFHSFGVTAKRFYCNLEPQNAQTFMFFDNFRVALFDCSDMNRSMKICAKNGLPYTLFDILVECFRYLKVRTTHKLNMLNASNTIDFQTIRYTIVLGSNGSLGARQMIRETAEKAALISRNFKCQLRLLSAVDVLAVSCLQNFQNGRISYLNSAQPYGRYTIVTEFESLLNEIFSRDFIHLFKRRCPGAWTDLLCTFEKKIESFESLREDELPPLLVSIPIILADMLRKKRRLKVQTAVKKYNNTDVSWSEQGMLKIHPKLLISMLECSIRTIINDIGITMSRAIVPNFLFIGGVWSRSSMLVDRIANAFSTTLRVGVICPHECPSNSAALLRDQPTIVNPNLSPVTFGVSVLNPFNPDLHPASKKLIKNGQHWCNDVFDRLIVKGCAEQRAVRRYCPASPNQNEMNITVYCSEISAPRYTTDEKVKKCGQIRLDLSQLTTNNADCDSLREVEVTLEYTDIGEINVYAKDIASAQQIVAQLDFL